MPTTLPRHPRIFRPCDGPDRPVVPGGAGGAMAPPIFGRSVNPISTEGGTLCPPHNYVPLHIFRPCDGPVICVVTLDMSARLRTFVTQVLCRKFFLRSIYSTFLLQTQFQLQKKALVPAIMCSLEIKVKNWYNLHRQQPVLRYVNFYDQTRQGTSKCGTTIHYILCTLYLLM